MEVPSEIMSRYIERRKKDLIECLSALRAHEFKDLEKVGHQLKGNGSTFGFPEISIIGKKLEISAASGDENAVESALNDLSGWLSTYH